MKYKVMVFAACLALLSGCSDAPSESVMEDQIEQSMNQQFGVEFIEIDDLEKVNGRADGDSKYIADLEFDIEYTKSVDEVSQAMLGDKSSTNSIVSQGAAMGLKMALGDFKAGDKKHVKNKFTFAKSENGWVLVK